MRNFKRKIKAIGDITISSIMQDIGSGSSLSLAAGVGLIQGLKYNGNLKRGVKAGLATMGVIVGVNVVKNIAYNWDTIQSLDDIIED